MNLKEYLIQLKRKITEKSPSDNYITFLKEAMNDTELTNEQFEFFKHLYLEDERTIGLHNTNNHNINSFFPMDYIIIVIFIIKNQKVLPIQLLLLLLLFLPFCITILIMLPSFYLYQMKQ